MTKKKYYLITSSDEQLWKFDRPVVFLGEWCRLKLRKHIWQSMEAIVADPYGIGLIEKNSNNSKVKKIQQKLFNNFYEILNKHHKTNYGKRFWQIIVGHWFDLYVHLIFKKVNTLKHCINSYDISGTTCYVTDNYNLATKDYGDSISALDDLRWNNFLNTRILDLLGKVNFPIDLLLSL